jgi:hypothetical protein
MPFIASNGNSGYWPPFEKPAAWTAQAIAFLLGY